MTSLSTLPGEQIDDIMSRVPITCLRSFRSTCKTWESLSKTRILGNAATTRKSFVGFVMKDFRACSLKLDLNEIQNVGDILINQVRKLAISEIFHCQRLLLCVCEDDKRNVQVWNPYLGLTKWIQPSTPLSRLAIVGLGFDSKSSYHKILHCFGKYEIYDFSSNSWKDLDDRPQCDIRHHQGGMTVKGNAYFVAQRVICQIFHEEGHEIEMTGTKVFLLCFDFTEETFGQRLHLPFPVSVEEEVRSNEIVTLSLVRDEQLAVLHQRGEKLEIWITTHIEREALSWSQFLEVELNCLPVEIRSGSFFVDEEKHIVVVFYLQKYKQTE